MSLAADIMKPANIVSAATAVVAFATIVTLARPLLTGSSLEARLKSVSTRREELRRKSREALATKATAGTLRHTDEGLYKKVVERLQLSRLLEDPKVVEKLAQAGYRGPRPVSTFYFFRLIMPFAFGLAVAIYLFLIKDFGLSTTMRIAASG
jgi:tight adherence protein C